MPALTPPWEIKRKLVVKAEEETDQRYGCKPVERDINDYIRFGVINLDKPAGPSSHEVTAWYQTSTKPRACGARRHPRPESHRHFASYAGRGNENRASPARVWQRIRVRNAAT